MLVRLKEPLDLYHQKRADKHGWLYIVTNYPATAIMMEGNKPLRFKNLYEAKSISTGVVCTFRPECVEVAEDAS